MTLHVVLALDEQKWGLSTDVVNICKIIASSPWQTRLVEDGFVWLRRAEHKASSLQLSDDALWHELIKRRLLQSRYS